MVERREQKPGWVVGSSGGRLVSAGWSAASEVARVSRRAGTRTPATATAAVERARRSSAFTLPRRIVRRVSPVSARETAPPNGERDVSGTTSLSRRRSHETKTRGPAWREEASCD